MHSLWILHRDIKPANIFLTRDNDVKLGDFGISKQLEATEDLAYTYVGTPVYMSPQNQYHRPYSSKSDVWALGCILYEMCCLRRPFVAVDKRRLKELVVKKKPQLISDFYSKELRDLIRDMLRLSEDKRPSITEIIQMDLFQNLGGNQSYVEGTLVEIMLLDQASSSAATTLIKDQKNIDLNEIEMCQSCGYTYIRYS